MLRRATGAFRSSKSGTEAPAPDQDALLASMRQEVAAGTLPGAFAGTSELPDGGAEQETALLRRYLVAEKLDVQKAARRLEGQQRWRAGWGSVSEEDVAVELSRGKCKLQPPTAGSGGRPLLIIKGARHRASPTPLAMQQFIYYCLESSSTYCWDPRNPDGKLVALFDLQGLQMKNLDAAALRASFHMLAEHFPERMVTVWMLEAPTIFWGLWKVVEPFIDRNARDHIHFVYGAKGKAALLEALGPEILPLEYGGTAAEVPLELAAQQLPAWRLKHMQHAQQETSDGTAAGEGAAVSPRHHEHGEAAQRAFHGPRLSASSSDLAAAT